MAPTYRSRRSQLTQNDCKTVHLTVGVVASLLATVSDGLATSAYDFTLS